MKKNLNFLKSNLIAHRGLFDNVNVAENSLSAFRAALKKNYIIELDVQMLKDGTLVVIHDNNLERLTGINKKVSEVTYSDIKDAILLSTSDGISLFSDVLSTINGKVPLVIELKKSFNDKQFIDNLMEILKKYNGKYVIKSFDTNLLNLFKKKNSQIPIGILISKRRNHFIWQYIYYKYFLKVDFVSIDHKLLNNRMFKLFFKDKFIMAWTIKKASDMQVLSHICDNFICENIDESL